MDNIDELVDIILSRVKLPWLDIEVDRRRKIAFLARFDSGCFVIADYLPSTWAYGAGCVFRLDPVKRVEDVEVAKIVPDCCREKALNQAILMNQMMAIFSRE